MNARDDHIARLFTAELQFRLASAVRLATTMNAQPLDLPMNWTQGGHRVKYGEIALRPDQADHAACFLQRSAMYLMAVAMKNATVAAVPDPKTSADSAVRSAYQVSRLIRNAFAHAPFSPRWSIDPDCRDKVFEVPDIIKLDTTGLHDVPLDWRHYGGPLALLHLCQFVRVDGDDHDAKARVWVGLTTGSSGRRCAPHLMLRVRRVRGSTDEARGFRESGGGSVSAGGAIRGGSSEQRE